MRYVIIVVSVTVYIFWDFYYHGGDTTEAVLQEFARLWAMTGL